LPAHVLREGYARASAWYERDAMLEDAVETALLAQDAPRAAALMERFVEEQDVTELMTVRRWVEQVPAEVIDAHPQLLFSAASAILYSLDRRAPETRIWVEAPLQRAERQWRARDDTRKLGELLAFRATLAWWQDDAAQSFALSRQALELLPVEETNWRGVATLQVAVELANAGDTGLSLLAQVSAQIGDLHQAGAIFRQVADEAEGVDSEDQGRAFDGLGQLACEWNDLDVAAGYTGDVAAIAGRLGDVAPGR
jgi:LuxR family transcriptional regulator, maltose regulon positive regulatory protein